MRNLLADLDLLRGLGADKSLLIRIDGDEFHALGAHLHHAVDGVSAAAADADHLYNDTVVVKIVFNLKRHL